MTCCVTMIRCGSMTVYWRAKFEKRIGSPIGFRTYNPVVNNFQSRSRKSEVCDLFFAGIRGTDRKRQQLACLGVRFRSCMTKEERRPQVKSHAGGSLPAGQDPDFFFDGGGQFGPNLGIFAFSSSDGNDFAWFAHGRY